MAEGRQGELVARYLHKPLVMLQFRGVRESALAQALIRNGSVGFVALVRIRNGEQQKGSTALIMMDMLLMLMIVMLMMFTNRFFVVYLLYRCCLLCLTS